MMCGTGIIDPGDSRSACWSSAATPPRRDMGPRPSPPATTDEGYVTPHQIPMAEWVYQNGPDQFANKVIFQNGIV